MQAPTPDKGHDHSPAHLLLRFGHHPVLPLKLLLPCPFRFSHSWLQCGPEQSCERLLLKTDHQVAICLSYLCLLHNALQNLGMVGVAAAAERAVLAASPHATGWPEASAKCLRV